MNVRRDLKGISVIKVGSDNVTAIYNSDDYSKVERPVADLVANRDFKENFVTKVSLNVLFYFFF